MISTFSIEYNAYVATDVLHNQYPGQYNVDICCISMQKYKRGMSLWHNLFNVFHNALITVFKYSVMKIIINVHNTSKSLYNMI